MTYAATAGWLRGRLWFGWVAGVAVWSIWLGSLALGGWTRDAEGQLFGPDRLKSLIASLPPDETLSGWAQTIRQRASEFSQPGALQDDIALLMLRRTA